MSIPNTRPWESEYSIKRTLVIAETPELRVVDLTLAPGECVPWKMEGIDMLATEMDRIMREYRRLRAVVPLGSIRTKKEYERAVGLLDAILDEIGEDEKHPMAELADAI